MKLNLNHRRMTLKKYNAKEWRPTGKQNCLCWLSDGRKVTAYYHQLKQAFIGLYEPFQNVELPGVLEWSYAILPKRTSNDLFPNMVDCLGLKDGLEVFRTDYSCLQMEQQERLFDENELIQATIMYVLKKKYEVVTCCKCGKVETDYNVSQKTWHSVGYNSDTATVLCECDKCYGKG